jgi:hypothetical protein
MAMEEILNRQDVSYPVDFVDYTARKSTDTIRKRCLHFFFGDEKNNIQTLQDSFGYKRQKDGIISSGL